MDDEKKLVLSTQKSIHKPIEVEIDNVTYYNKPLSRATFDEVKKHEKAAIGGDIEALYKQVEVLYGVPMKVLNKLDIRDVSTIINHTMNKIVQAQPKTDKEKAEKNGLKPGQKESA